MALTVGEAVRLDIERPVAGGRMLARHEGQVVLVSGVIPGERVTARVERTGKSLAYAEVISVDEPSPDRRADTDWKCGGSVYGFISYPRQCVLKAEVIADAFRRVGRHPLPALPPVVESPEREHRMRTRLHVKDGRLGFFREGTHALCDAAATGQLSAGALEWMRRAEAHLRREGLETLAAVEMAENRAGDQRAAHIESNGEVEPGQLRALAEGLTGLTLQTAAGPAIGHVAGDPSVTDRLHPRPGPSEPEYALTRNVRSFFQTNRFLLEPLLQLVVAVARPGPAADLYAGVGLFGLGLASAGQDQVTLVEGDRVSGGDLVHNARPFGERVRVVRASVEAFLAGRLPPVETCVVDPPRTGLSAGARAGLIRMAARRVVYVSCDVATLARDSRVLLDAGYVLASVTGVDLFPNTAHIETVCVFDRPSA